MSEIWTLAKGFQMHNVKTENGLKSFYEFQELPEGYMPPDDYIKQKLVIKSEKNDKNEKTSEKIKEKTRKTEANINE